MMNRLVAVLVVSGAALVAQPTLAAPQSSPTNHPLAVGDPAPPIDFDVVLDGSSEQNLTWDDLKGQAIVLEFWATWCGPCVEAIPHLNALADALRDQPIRFVSVTNEPPDDVLSFLHDHPMRGLVAIAPDAPFSASYHVGGIPATFLISSRGRIVAITHPQMLTTLILHHVLEGAPVDIPVEPAIHLPAAGADPSDPSSKSNSLFRLEVRGCADPSHAALVSSKDAGELTAVCLNADRLLSVAFDIPIDRVVQADLLPPDRFTAILSSSSGSAERAWMMLRQALQSAFGVTARFEDRETVVFLLRCLPDVPLGLKPSIDKPRQIQIQRSAWRATSVPVSMLCSLLEDDFAKPTFNDTGIEGNVSFELKATFEDPASLRTALRGLGLEVVPARRIVKLLVIEKSP